MKFGIAPLILLLLPANLVNIVGAKDTVYAPKPVNELRQEEDDIGMRIVNGVEVNPKFKYPYMVYAGGCGASLVAPNVVLCAAHCAGFISSVQIGRHNINDGSEDFETFDVLQEVPHPSYNDDTLDYDFMMMRLDGSSSRTPVQLDSGISLDSGRDVIAMGWGTTSSGGFSSSVLLEVELDLKSQSECNSNYGAGQITDRMVCAARATKDSCQGDSGGPLIDKATGVQVGVVSWGYGCADSRYPGVYAKVQDQKDWIQSYIDLWSDGPSPPTPPPVTSPTPPPTECTDFSGWVDSYGDGCDWYVANDNEGSCDTYGWGYDGGLGTAQEACCYCGGGNRGPTTPPPTPSPTVPPTPNPTRPPTPNPTRPPTPSPTTLPPVTSPTPPPATSPTPSECTDYPAWVDSYGDGCDWYSANDNEGSCDTYGSGYDAGFGTAQEACCYCGGGNTGPTTPPPTPSPTVPPTPNPTRPPTPSPTTLPPVTSPSPPPATSPTPSECADYPAWVDSYGDGCDWYAANDNEGSCDTFGSSYDAGFGTAQEACCYCGGGNTGPTPPPVTSPTPPPATSPTPSGCTDYPAWVDSYGDGCDWYAANDNEGSCDTFGSGFDAGFGTAQEACCYCGGGDTGNGI